MNINPELTRIHVKNRSFFFKKNSKQTLEILNFRTCVKDQWKDCPFTDTKTSARTMTYFHCFFLFVFFLFFKYHSGIRASYSTKLCLVLLTTFYTTIK